MLPYTEYLQVSLINNNVSDIILIMMFSIIRYTRKSVSPSCRVPAASHVEWHRREHDSEREIETGRSNDKRDVC